jgi:hypothetical protein
MLLINLNLLIKRKRKKKKKKNQVCYHGGSEGRKKKLGFSRLWKKFLEWLWAALDLVSVFEFKRVWLSLKPKQGSWARLKPMMKKMDTVGFGFSSVDLDLGFLGPYAGSDPAQPETSSVAFLAADLGLLVFGGFAVRQLGSSHEFVSPVESMFVLLD